MERVLITGATGLLGKNILSIIDKGKYEVLSPSSLQMNVKDIQSVKRYFENNNIDICIHSAALTNVGNIEKDIKITQEAIYTNSVGTANILMCCMENDTKMVYISTDHVFDGKKGNYTKEDKINPLSKYAKTKAAGELLVRTYQNSLVIRTSFFGEKFPYEKAFIDQWSSKDYIDVMAPKILQACLSTSVGIKHVYSERRTLHEIATYRGDKVEKIKMSDLGSSIPRPTDTSLN